jgi:hypothetical protein
MSLVFVTTLPLPEIPLSQPFITQDESVNKMAVARIVSFFIDRKFE